MKVLIISHNPLSDQTNMGKTFLSLFSCFDREELCQLYIYPTVPNGDYCASCYRITDKEALRHFLLPRPIGGPVAPQQIRPDAGMFEQEKDRKLYRSRKNKSPLRRLLRDLLWRRADWYNDRLRAWLDREQPERVFVAPGAGMFLYDIALRICHARRIPLAVYLCDEYYFVKPGRHPLEQLRQHLLQKKMQTLLWDADSLLVISPEMQAQYASHFSLPVHTVMTGASFPPAAHPSCSETPQRICYFGNIRCGRYLSLMQVAQELDALNRRQACAFTLDIYTAEQDRVILEQLCRYSCVRLRGFVSGKDYTRALQSAGLLLHAESFDPEYTDFTRHSISTKIADYLASGVPVLAYGPAHIASIAHLQRQNCALMATDRRDLAAALEKAFFGGAAVRQLCANAIAAARTYHTDAQSSALVRNILTQLPKRKGKVLQINNLYASGSTGKLTELMHFHLRRAGYTTRVIYGRGEKTDAPGVRRLCPQWYAKANALACRLMHNRFGFCRFSTARLLHLLRTERPDIVHLQCINGSFVNIYRLVRWLNQNHIRTVVSLHAEFMYTGGCAHALACDQWQHSCRKCPQKLPGAARSFRRMAAAFAGFRDNCILCPVSDWGAERARRAAILRDFPVHTLPNGVDTQIFYPKAQLPRQHNRILHVTAHFSPVKNHAKGGYYLLELARRLPDVEFLVAGRCDRIDNLPSNVTLLGHIADQRQLAQLYRSARLTVLTSKAETFGMPCAESLCCGTPVVAFRCGGAESIAMPQASTFVPFGDIQALYDAVQQWLARPALVSPDACTIYGGRQMCRRLEEIYEQFHITPAYIPEAADGAHCTCSAEQSV